MSSLRLSELLVGLSRIADIGMGLEPGEAARAAVIAAQLTRELDLPEPSDIYYVTLLQHVGCTAYSHEVAALLGGDDIAVKSAAARTDFDDASDVLLRYLARLAPDAGAGTRLRAASVAALRARQITAGYSQANCEVAARTAQRAGLGPGVQRGLTDIYEAWNGKGGPRGAVTDAIALPARVAQVAATAALFDRVGGPLLAVETISRRSGRSLDPSLAAELCSRAQRILGELSSADAVLAAVEAEPSPPVLVPDGGLDAVCRAFGDAVDLKSPFHHGHSARVADLAASAAERLGLDAADLRRAGFLHDLGRATVPNAIWEKPGPLTSSEWERVRLHAYHSERVLTRCGPLAGLAPLVGMHHERLDGSGYHRQSRAAAIPMTARVLAACDVFDAMTRARAHRPALAAESAAAELRAEAGAGRLDPDAVAAVLAVAGQPAAPVRAPVAGGLTARQLEVLRLVAEGLSNPQIAARLVLSRRTAERHVQDIYARIGVSSRAAAALFAMEHDLLR
jgi:HD-GYP domain-containing protein (c-di-GMP phosphodiesterase class II)